ncbi:hypothetical protein V3C99_001125 [Haemonchus contortus]|uniref:Secreted protein n=1 Tax=Haemonchus contortus TaxID=6289 RepID=A0A7I4YE34_HAECO
MLFTCLVLVSFLANAAAQGESSALQDEVKEALRYVNEADNENIMWDPDLAEIAQRLVNDPKTVDADLRIKKNKCFKKKDEDLGSTK